jgi:two-component system, OmpR family, sensor kinase
MTAADRRRRGAYVLRSARVRILTSVIGLLVVSTAVAALLDRQLLLGRVDERVDDSLVQEVEEFRRLVRDGRNPATGEPFGDDVEAIFTVFLQRNVTGEGEDFFTFVDGRPYRSTAPDALGDAVLGAAPGLGRARDVRRGDVRTGDDVRRYLAVPVVIDGRQRGVFAVTSTISREREEVTDVLRVTLGVSLLVLLLASGAAFVAAGRVLAPLRDVTETARAISETDLTRRIPVEGRDEIADLARTFNAMLDRLEQAFALQKEFLSDAGHELRTPITIIRGHLELLGDDPREREEVVELACDELDRMGRLVDELMLLARAQRPDFLRPEPIDLHAFTHELHAKATALAERDWRVDARAGGRIVADRQRLTQAVMNLARNAAEHTPPGARIELGSAIADGQARLWVTDSGSGVPPRERERIFERFARGGGRRTSEGAGLGLAIVRAVAEAHGGSVRLESPDAGGATFTIAVPTRAKEVERA